MNKVILDAMLWIENPDSVSLEQRKANAADATAASRASRAADIAAYAASRASRAADIAAAYTAAYAAEAQYWVDEYFRITGENKQDYIDKIKGKALSKEMHDAIVKFNETLPLALQKEFEALIAPHV